MKTVGFIGVGLMGSGMVRNLIKAGFTVTVYDVFREKAETLAADGAIVADSIAQCAKDKDAVISIVGYPKEVEAVYFGPEGVLENAIPGTLIIDMSTGSPATAKLIAGEAKKRGMEALDGPVSGGSVGAANGTLAIMVGGEKSTFERAMPLLDAMGGNIKLQGPPGSGQHVKMANQIAAIGCLAGVCEAIAYIKAAGLDPELMINTICTGAAGSKQMDLMGPKILAGDNSPIFQLKHMLKDLNIVMEESETLGRDLPMTKFVWEAYKILADKGMGDYGSHALIYYYDEKK
jgi:3-hydroxyisobutyrate dehydrogenase-like beta-hydroxyacid dehydrogenase